MSRKATSRQKLANSTRRRRRQVAIATCVALSLIGGTMLAYSGALHSAFKQKEKNGGTVSLQSFNADSPSKELVYAGGRLLATEEPPGGGGCTPPTAPVLTTSIVNSVITLNWTVPAGTETFDVERTPRISVPFSPIATNLSGTTTTWQDSVSFSGVNPDGSNSLVTYIYRVVAHIGECSAPSNRDWATNISFAEVITSVQTIIKAHHITELRVAVNSVWKAADQSPETIIWTDPVGGGVAGLANFPISKVHVDELRAKVNQAMDVIQPGFSSQHPYTDHTLIQFSTPVKAIHLIQLRDRVK